MPTFNGSNHLPFFKTLHRNFSEALQDDPDRALQRRDPIESLLEDCSRSSSEIRKTPLASSATAAAPVVARLEWPRPRLKSC